MAETQTYFRANNRGPGDVINLPFSLLDTDYIRVTADGALQSPTLFMWTGAQQITLGADFPETLDFKVERRSVVETWASQPLSGYFDARKVNDNFELVFNSLQEHRDKLEGVDWEDIEDAATNADRAEAAAAVVWSLVGSGAGLDGVGDDLAAVQLALNIRAADGGGKVTTGGKSFKIVGRLRIPDGVELDMQTGQVILGSTTSGIDLGDSAFGGFINAQGVVGFTGPALKSSDEEYFNRQDSYNWGIRAGSVLLGPGNGLGASGTGLQLHSGPTAAIKGVTGLVVPDIQILNFHTGIHLWAEGSSNWVNGNEINASIYGCVRMIDIEKGSSGAETNGNTFRGRIQPNTGVAMAEYSIRDEGINNSFFMTTWDWNASGSTIAYDLEEGSAGVIIDQISDDYIRRGGADGQDDYFIVALSGSGRPYGVYPSPPGTTENASYTGADDFLANAPDFFTVSSSGDTVTNLANAFKNDAATASCTLTGTGLAVTIDLAAAKSYLMGLGVLFGFSSICTGVLIERSLDGSAWTTVVSKSDNANYLVGKFGKTFLAGSFRYLRYTFTGSGQTISLQRFFAFSPDVPGNVWLNKESSNYQVPVNFASYAAADYALADSGSAQNLLPSSQDEVALQANTVYDYEMVLRVSRSAGTTAHTIALLFDGTATLNYLNLTAIVSNANAGSIGTVLGMRDITSKSGATITASNNSATENLLVVVRGSLQVTGAGSLIPQIQYSSAPGGAPSVTKGSFIKVSKAGAASFTKRGPWT